MEINATNIASLLGLLFLIWLGYEIKKTASKNKGLDYSEVTMVFISNNILIIVEILLMLFGITEAITAATITETGDSNPIVSLIRHISIAAASIIIPFGIFGQLKEAWDSFFLDIPLDKKIGVIFKEVIEAIVVIIIAFCMPIILMMMISKNAGELDEFLTVMFGGSFVANVQTFKEGAIVTELMVINKNSWFNLSLVKYLSEGVFGSLVVMFLHYIIILYAIIKSFGIIIKQKTEEWQTTTEDEEDEEDEDEEDTSDILARLGAADRNRLSSLLKNAINELKVEKNLSSSTIYEYNSITKQIDRFTANDLDKDVKQKVFEIIKDIDDTNKSDNNKKVTALILESFKEGKIKGN